MSTPPFSSSESLDGAATRFRADVGARFSAGHGENSRTVDLDAVMAATRALLRAIGEDPERPELKESPRRIAESWRDFFATTDARIRPIAIANGSHNDVVMVRGIDFVSVCEHHLLPFAGVVHVAYQPRDVVLGLSDIPRIVRHTTSRLHLQESLTNDIADMLSDATAADGVLVVVEARHGCVSDRGVRQARARAVTVTARGDFGVPERHASVLTLLLGQQADLPPHRIDV